MTKGILMKNIEMYVSKQIFLFLLQIGNDRIRASV